MASAVMTWEPQRYLAFADQRLRPALELLARVPLQEAQDIVDLGCGAGNVTGHLRQRWPAAAITGVDSAPEMLAAARKQAIPGPPVRWEQQDVAQWRPGAPVHLIYSNAALHWVPHHPRLFPALLGHLRPGGVLAVQMPCNFSQPSHTLVKTAAQAGPWWQRLQPRFQPAPLLEPQGYYDLLAPRCRAVDIWRTEYLQVLEGESPVADFTKGSFLKYFLDALEEPERSQFEAVYRRLVRQAYPHRHGGRTVFPMHRLFIVAQRQ